MYTRILTLCTALGLALALGTVDAGAQGGARKNVVGAVYTATNAADGNAVLVFDRLLDGRIVPGVSVPTGGDGSGDGLGNQGGLVLTRDGRLLLVVNAGSHSISVFKVHPRGLRLLDVEPSGGMRPVSVTEHHGVVYVVNAGSDNISGFRIQYDGHLQPLDGSTRALSGSGTGAAQIGFSPDGNVLLVTEKATNKLVTFQVDRDGYAGQGQVQDSNGETPFGFAFGMRNQLFVSEAFGGAPDASATSSYAVDDAGLLTTITPSARTNQTALCWLVVTPDGRYAYGTNAGSGSISGYLIGFDGTIELLDADGRTGVTGGGPIDMALTADGRYLYILVGGTNAIAAFSVESDGSLTLLPDASAVPAGANGLAVR